MIKNPELLDALHRRYEQERLADMSFEAALDIYAALWAEARALGVDGATDWKSDVESTLAMARILNGSS